MNRTTGTAIDSTAHIAQSIGDILTTPIGSRVMRREYGSLLPDLIDAPFNDATRLQAYAAVAMALLRWEPRIRLSRVQLDLGEQAGQVLLDIEGS
ncbi:GPW/gp25 family protein, partial [Stutzerimonas stutzeri]|uniref:GPW/gp25 family protein n=1 Tax=Stutzerimonas stutzeri TaxID=316 RepID=UPI00244D34B5